MIAFPWDDTFGALGGEDSEAALCDIERHTTLQNVLMDITTQVRHRGE